MKPDPEGLTLFHRALFFMLDLPETKQMVYQVLEGHPFEGVAIKLPRPVVEVVDILLHQHLTKLYDSLELFVVLVLNTPTQERVIPFLRTRRLAHQPRVRWSV